MSALKFLPARSEASLRERIVRLFGRPVSVRKSPSQAGLDFFGSLSDQARIESPATSVFLFLNFVSDTLPDGDVYLFGGLLRDMALYGRRGFSSDVDLVVEGDWEGLQGYLASLGANKNKFGGYRLNVAGWPVDIWHARETWAVRNGFVRYDGIASLTETTVLNWDAILMNWRTKAFTYRRRYFEELLRRDLDVVLEENPNPLGTAVRVLRHFCQKDAVRVSAKAAVYLSKCAKAFDFYALKSAEIESYGNSFIDPLVHEYFRVMNCQGNDLQQEFQLATSIVSPRTNLVF